MAIEKTLLDRAIEFAAEKHAGQCRKGTTFPYMVHVVEAMEIVCRMTEDEEIRAAAVLHDTLEDTDTTKEELIKNFGDRVADLVAAESENKREDQPAEDTWGIRKQETIRHLLKASTEIRMIALGDKLANVRAMCRDYMVIEEKLWERFNEKNPVMIGMYYGQLANIFGSDEFINKTEAYKEYYKLCSVLFSGEYDGDGNLLEPQQEREEVEAINENRFPCDNDNIADGKEARKNLKIKYIRKYDTSKLKIDTDKLYKCMKLLYSAPMVDRELVRCKECGALMIYQCICDPNIYDGFEYLEDWIPVHSEEEADRLNESLDPTDFPVYPVRHLQAIDRVLRWSSGEGTEQTEGTGK